MRTPALNLTFSWAGALTAACMAVSANAAPTAAVLEGALTGLSADGVDRFLGIPYAAPPIGKLRWRPPQAPTAWSGTRAATSFGATCPQSADMFGPKSINEDCLTLNVYAPATKSASPRPVIVWVHGGGFRNGAGSYYDATVMAKKTDAVVVTINYRLGVLGFLSTSGMAAEGKALNFGLQDQYFALNWVKRNIASFGGDAGRVTIAGQSSGGASGCLAMSSPKAAGLFHRVIMSSAPCSIATTPLSKAVATGDGIATKAGCATGADQMACLRSKSTDELMDAAQITSAAQAISDSMWPATVDGEVIPNPVMSALAWGRINRVPVMLGTTQDEGKGLIGWGFHGIFGRSVTQAEYEGAMRNFAGDLGAQLVPSLYPASKYGSVDLALSAALTDIALACPANNAASSLASQVPTYAFEFADKQAPQFFADPLMPEGWGAYHAGDLLYVFQRPVSGLAMPSMSTAQMALSEQMLGYWRHFVASGNPNGDASGPNWPKFDRTTTPFQTLQPGGITTQTNGQFQKAHQCLIWSSLYGLGAVFGAL